MEVMAGICLCIQSIWDIKTKEIPLWISLGFGSCSFLYSISCQREWNSFVWSILPGVLCLCLSVCTREAIGFGDGILLCAFAMLYSIEELMKMIIIAIIFAGIFGLLLMVCFHKSGKYEIPFVPFLFLGWIVSYGVPIVERLLV